MKTAPSDDAGKTSIQVIERMISLLDTLALYPDPVSLKELSAATSLHPSTAHRILNDLVKFGLHDTYALNDDIFFVGDE